jgi:hypothetical protein
VVRIQPVVCSEPWPSISECHISWVILQLWTVRYYYMPGTAVNIYQTVWQHITEDSTLQGHCHEILKSHTPRKMS